MVLGLRHFTDRIANGTGEPVLDVENGEEMMHVQPRVAIVLANLPPESPGTLYISTKRVIWLSDVDRESGYNVDFVSVSLHAVSRDPEAYPSPCIYTQIETENGEDKDSTDSESESSETRDISKITEMRLILSDASQLDALFDIFCDCAELNPEPNDDDEEEHDWIYGNQPMIDDIMGTEGEDPEWQFSDNSANPIGYSNGDHDIARSVLELQISDKRFDDAEEMKRDVHSAHN